MDTAEGIPNQLLIEFLGSNLPKAKKDKKDAKFVLGVVDTKLGGALSESVGYKCRNDETVLELMRGIRLHFVHFVKGLKNSDLVQAQLAVGHATSRSKIKFNVHQVDMMVIQSMSLLDQLDKDVNTFAMRVRFVA